MLYRIVRPFATVALKTNFRKIYFSNAQVIPRNKPVILAVNHPTAFLEPCLLACLLPQPLHFIVRGDLFKGSLIKKIFAWLHLIPIFRLRDAGYSGLKNNYQTFEKCYETLNQNKTILILAEGNTIHEKRLRPIQKGTARMALGALEKYPDLDLQIVPVGVNYTYAERFRSEVMFEFGAPIAAQKYLNGFQENPNTAINELTEELGAQLKKHVIVIEKPEDDRLTEKLLYINRNNYPSPARPVVSLNNHLLKSEMAIVDGVNKMPESKKHELKENANAYFEKLDKLNLEDWAVAQEGAKINSNWMTIIFGAIPFFLGLVGNFLPAYLAAFISTTKVKLIEFKASVRVAVAIGAFLIYYAILLVLGLLFKNLFLLGFILFLPFLGYYAVLYVEYFKKWQWLRAIRKVDQVTVEKLRKERKNLVGLVLN